MSIKTVSYELYPLGNGGMDERWRPKDNAAELIRDMSWSTKGSWREGPGYRCISDDFTSQIGGETTDAFTSASVGRILSLHWFSQHNGARQWLLWEQADGALVYFDGSQANGTPSVVWSAVKDQGGSTYGTSGRAAVDSPNAGTQSISYGGRLYLMNGYDEPIVFNGRYVERAGFTSRPPPPILSAPLGMNTTNKPIGLGMSSDDGKASGYRYKVTYLNERGQESEPSEASEIVYFETSNARRIVWVEIPIGGPEVVARRIYRTQDLLDAQGEPRNLGYGAMYFYHSEIQDNVADSVEDLVPDSQLGSVLNESADLGPWPPNAHYMAVFKNTMFVAGNGENTLRFSRALHPEVFPADNYFDLGGSHGGPVTGMRTTRNALVVFRQGSITLIKGDPRSGFQSSTLTVDTGCAAPMSIAEIPGLGLAFLGLDGVYLLQGALENTGTVTQIVNIGSQIGDRLERLNRSALANARGVVYRRENEFWLAVPTLGSTENNLVLVYHYLTGAWSIRENFPISCAVESRDHRGYLFFGSNDTSNQGIHVVTRGKAKKGSRSESSVEPLYETTHIDFGQLYRSVSLKYCHVQAIAWGDNDLGLNYRVNNAKRNVRTASDKVDQQDLADPAPVYGTATFGGSSLTAPRPVILRYDCSTAFTGRGPAREIQVSLEPDGGKVELVAIELEIAAGHPRNVRPLSSKHGSGGRG